MTGLPDDDVIEHLMLYSMDIGNPHHVGACVTDDNDVSIHF